MHTADPQIPQHLTAIVEAQRVRMAAVAIRRQVRAGTITVGDALEHPDAQSLELGRLLSAQHRWGPRRISRLCRLLRIPENRRIAAIPPGKRAAIADLTTQPEGTWHKRAHQHLTGGPQHA